MEKAITFVACFPADIRRAVASEAINLIIAQSSVHAGWIKALVNV